MLRTQRIADLQAQDDKSAYSAVTQRLQHITCAEAAILGAPTQLLYLLEEWHEYCNDLPSCTAG